MPTKLDTNANHEQWPGHPYGLRFRRHPRLAAANAHFPAMGQIRADGNLPGLARHGSQAGSFFYVDGPAGSLGWGAINEEPDLGRTDPYFLKNMPWSELP